ncbi:hypothetical protein ACFCZ6_14335 [Streptomyces hydrogenans]|uniref:hypothetical protein n=1 Tax=Streptomyces hydrogenans TaxID=1873719 RepID=UPI0035DAB840
MSARQHPLFGRYMAAFEAWNRHTDGCTCTPEAPCTAGNPLFERFSRLQEAWNNHLNQQQRR